MKEFFPKIDRTLFREKILHIQENEGNDIEVVSLLKNKLRNGTEQNFFDLFMIICKEYKIDYYSFENTEEKTEKYKVIITFTGYDSHEMNYSDKELDISVALAKTLYNLVAVMIKNDFYLKALKDS